MQSIPFQAVEVPPAHAALLLRVTETTLATWRSRGGGPAYIKRGGRVLYRLADLQAFMATRNIEQGEPA
ncbi:helix-turn-helix domain-containing protein [Jeongeupia naejangsanensis]|uniref:helix-turn-helix domain-containing protein n=1 Tax=Jeongeupia naejangsanensis TaxID=613195 RepID=UPI001EF0C3EA|nr:helix-turn-helix domain-containing protein [Jeongeupia naejangsanensis]